MPRDKTTGEWICSKPGCEERRPEMFSSKSYYCKACVREREVEKRQVLKTDPDKLAKQYARKKAYHHAWLQKQDRREYLKKKREDTLLHKHGLTPEQDAALGNICGICGKECEGSDRHIHHIHNLPGCDHPVTHTCHKCRVGILCATHNKLSGMAGDDLAVLQAAVRFVETKHKGLDLAA